MGLAQVLDLKSPEHQPDAIQAERRISSAVPPCRVLAGSSPTAIEFGPEQVCSVQQIIGLPNP